MTAWLFKIAGTNTLLLFTEPLVIDDHQSQFFMPESPGEPEFAESETNVTAQLGGSVTIFNTLHSERQWSKKLDCFNLMPKCFLKRSNFFVRLALWYVFEIASRSSYTARSSTLATEPWVIQALVQFKNKLNEKKSFVCFLGMTRHFKALIISLQSYKHK